ncbi:MAG: T9SS type A sorting domain-containing protein [Bacteroidales bacterium]|nr:T9SS type A sorting domain-containing protein [Bacteroidales bacterium]
MKKFYLSVCLVLCSIVLFAQPTLDYPQNAPEIGDIMEIQFVSPEGLSSGAAGPDATWDFSSLTNVWDPGQITVISPASAPSGNDFPDANIVLNMNDTIYTYAKTDETGFYYLGSQITTAQIPVLFIYSNIRTYLQFPFTYGDSFTDDYTGVSTAMMTEIRLTATSSVAADAYGTLILPTGTYSDVLRTLTIDNEIDSIFVNDIFVSTIVTNRTQYHWFAPNSKGPLFSMEISDCTGVCDTTCYYTMLEAGFQESPKETLTELSTYPNPADDHITVSFRKMQHNTVTISVVNQIGQVVIERGLPESKFGSVKERFDISSLPSGIYFANVCDKSGVQITEKFVIR